MGILIALILLVATITGLGVFFLVIGLFATMLGAYLDGKTGYSGGRYFNNRSHLASWAYDYGYEAYDRSADRKAAAILRNARMSMHR